MSSTPAADRRSLEIRVTPHGDRKHHVRVDVFEGARHVGFASDVVEVHSLATWAPAPMSTSVIRALSELLNGLF